MSPFTKTYFIDKLFHVVITILLAVCGFIASTKTTSGTGGAKDLIWIDYISMYLGALTR